VTWTIESRCAATASTTPAIPRPSSATVRATADATTVHCAPDGRVRACSSVAEVLAGLDGDVQRVVEVLDQTDLAAGSGGRREFNSPALGRVPPWAAATLSSDVAMKSYAVGVVLGQEVADRELHGCAGGGVVHAVYAQ